MKPIETRYKGNRFRSRLEARWAVFFDTLGIPFQYEPEGFKFDDGTHYLPDFWLPDHNVWVEVKGGIISTEDEHKVLQLARHSGDDTGVCVFGNIPRVFFDSEAYSNGRYEYRFEELLPGKSYCHWSYEGREGIEIQPVAWHFCPWCKSLAISDLEHGFICSCYQELYKQFPVPPFENDDLEWSISRMNAYFHETHDHPKLMRAYLAASQARFEHGEQG